MRICFDLLEMLKAQRKRIRIAANNTFIILPKLLDPKM